MTEQMEELVEENLSLKDQLATLSKTHAKDRQRLDELLSDYVRDKRIIGEALGLVGENAMIHFSQMRAILALQEQSCPDAGDRIERLRKALVLLVGSDDKEELEGMRDVMKDVPVSDAEMLAEVNAIEALLAELKASE